MAWLQYHLFADDMQGLKHGLLTDVSKIVSTLADCTTDVLAWCAAKHLQLNADKTEVMWFGLAAKLNKISPASSSIRIGSIDVQPVTIVRDLGVMTNAEFSMYNHVSRTAQTCFSDLHLHHLLGCDVTVWLVSAFVLLKLVLLRSSPPTSPLRWIASTASPPPPRWQLMFSTVGVQ